jgi:ABC-type phosphate/phosphonate transport system substrate-binding protein
MIGQSQVHGRGRADVTARAGLPMYDLAELRPATEAWWEGLARAFRAEGLDNVPAGLSQDWPARKLWQAPDLLFGQTCGYPLMHGLSASLRLVATPCYAAPGCSGPEYCSLVLVREDDAASGLAMLRGRTAVINAPDSHSGCNVLRALAAPLAADGRFFRRVIVSGSHLGSLRTLRRGAADVAAIDCVLHALLERHRPSALVGLRTLLRSPSAPGLPYVTGALQPCDAVRRLRAGLLRALADPKLAACRTDLLIERASVLSLEDYGVIADLERRARALGYAELA